MEQPTPTNRQLASILLFVVLVVGSVIFFFHLLSTVEGRGSGDNTTLSIWGLKRGILDIGLYLIFVSMIFGVNFLLVKKD